MIYKINNLIKAHKSIDLRMNTKQFVLSTRTVPFSALIILTSILCLGLFFVGFDQGHFFSIVQGEDAFIEQFLHEFTHDMRHAAGFPCH
jgi:predicted RND superfamily exporter protein